MKNKKEWEAFWQWLSRQGYTSEYEESSSFWLTQRMREWEAFEMCKKCGIKGVHKLHQKYGKYIITRYNLCEVCNDISDEEEAFDKSMVIEDIESGDMSPSNIRLLIEDFNLKPEDVKPNWVKAIIKEFLLEVEELIEFGREEK